MEITDFIPFFSALVGALGGMMVGFRTAKSQLMKINAEEEQNIFNKTKSLVTNQYKHFYEIIRDDPNYHDDFIKGKMPPMLGSEAKNNVYRQLLTELGSDRLSKASRVMMMANLEVTIESTVTEFKKELGDKQRKILNELTPLVVDSILLNYKTMEDAKNNYEYIAKESIDYLRKIADDDLLLISEYQLSVNVKSALYNKINKQNQN